MIKGVLFDLGGTLHVSSYPEGRDVWFAKRVLDRLEDYGIVLDLTPGELTAQLARNAEEYKHMTENSLRELSPAEVWSDWYLREQEVSRERLEPVAEELSFLYDYERPRIMRRPHLKESLETLQGMGVRMGVISNIISLSVVPHFLKEYGIDQYMECVVTSSGTGLRKPSPEIFRVAEREMGLRPEELAYVGDTISRDVRGCRNAGWAVMIQIRNPGIAHRDKGLEDGPYKPDHLIDDLSQIPEIIRRINEGEELPETAEKTEGGLTVKKNIDTIFFDVGATLRYVVEDTEFAAAAERELMDLVGAAEPHDQFFAKLENNWKAYRKWAKSELIDVSEMELWLQYLLPDYPADKVAPNAARLTRLWRDHDGRRVVHDGTLETLRELKARGYKLGIIANTITETEIPDWMCRDHVADCFKTVILSSKVRLRKPDPAIYLLASRCIGSAPENCAYVGDNPVRDVEGAVNSGYGAMILFEDAGTADREGKAPTVSPDYTIKSIPELLELFPARG